jgi:hypothetical protein
VASAAAAAGTVSVEPGVAFRVAEERSWAGRTFRRVGLPQLPGWRAVVGHDLKTVTRSSGRILLMAGIAAVPSVVVDVVGAGRLPAAAWLCCALVAVGLFTSKRSA